MAGTTTTPRQRARAQAIRDIKRIARRQLATEGGAGLSLRAIARELGIVSSAVYRYVPSRDELLTMLIEDAYNSVGDVAEKADAGCARDDVTGRWMAIGRAVRGWAVGHSSEYALVYGSPVPGYAAPAERTVAPGTRVTMLLVEVVATLERSGAAPAAAPAPVVSDALRREFDDLRASLDVDLPDDRLARTILAWSGLFGLISFELFGQLVGGIADHPTHFDHQLTRLALLVGLPVPPDQLAG